MLDLGLHSLHIIRNKRYPTCIHIWVRRRKLIRDCLESRLIIKLYGEWGLYPLLRNPDMSSFLPVKCAVKSPTYSKKKKERDRFNYPKNQQVKKPRSVAGNYCCWMGPDSNRPINLNRGNN